MLIFHLWPAVLPGGYVGVDVFFVISGYLITGLLARAALRDGRISLIDFYSRRARRLLPAATLVLAATLVGTLVFLPEARWHETATQIAASAVYVQNWVLAWLTGDYLDAKNAASPVQHYWSLSIEEQFYVLWPLVMLGALSLARRLGMSVRRIFFLCLSVIFLVSLATSIVMTQWDPAQSYYVTHTRIWELALGGLLALSIHRFAIRGGIGVFMLVTGLAVIAWSAAAFSTETLFPGYLALAPTLGTVLVILAGDVRLGAFRGLDARWLRWLGDRSYSIYLWHWPIVVFYVASVNRAVGVVDGICLLVLTLVLAHLSYEHVEERFRHGAGRAEWRPIAYGLASIAVCVAVPLALQQVITMRTQAAIEAADARYPGPAVLLANAPVPAEAPLLPPLTGLRDDLPVVYEKKCHQNQRDSEPLFCELGAVEAERTVVLFGDSHAAQWVPALDPVAKSRGYRLVTFTKSDCAYARTGPPEEGNEAKESCAEWKERVVDEISSMRPDLVITAQLRRGQGKTMRAGMRSVWEDIRRSGARVVALRDTPRLPFDPAECLSTEGADCTVERLAAEAPETEKRAAEGVEGVRVVDLTDMICGPKRCDAVVGNVVVFRDAGHLTATYAEDLAPYVAERIAFSATDGTPAKTDDLTVRAELR